LLLRQKAVIPAQAGIHLDRQVTSSHRSRHRGFVSSISSNFQARFHFFTCVSRLLADWKVVGSSCPADPEVKMDSRVRGNNDTF
jgi:hypothetical protein